MMGAGMGALAGGAMGAIGGYFGRKDQKAQQRMALSQLQPGRMLEMQGALYPEFMGYKQGGHQDLLASLIGGAQAAGGNAQTSFNDILARSGLLGGGMQMGGNAAIGLQTGQNINQARVQAMLQLMSGEQNTMQGVLQRALGYGGVVGQNPVNMNPFIGAMQGMGMGAQMFQPSQQQSAAQQWQGGLDKYQTTPQNLASVFG